MEWNLSPEQDAYQEAFRGWLADVAPPDAVRRWLDAGDAADFEKLFADGGWGGVGLPEDLGGQGGGLVELALTAEELARAAAPSAGLAGHRCSPCPRSPWPGTVTSPSPWPARPRPT